ncbi:hypothetical protein [Glaciihabitans sp. dw_435]|uniref:hypothetical protein n=1 Tax=Glaciihabitans sp. dw_435 TaxID=2720081 RepID=UPI001BD27790|nr:hypothetical protein [Glaciihabitans sp. dw_435]
MRARIAASVVLATGLMLASTGCTFFSPISTQLAYDASDGISTTVGDIEVRNAFAVTADGTNVNLVMVMINSGTETQVVKVQYNFDSTTEKPSDQLVTIEAGETISFGNGNGAPNMVLENVDAKLGGLLPVFIQYGSETGQTMLVPVLDNSLPGYSTLLPTVTPTPTVVPTSKPTATAGPVTG